MSRIAFMLLMTSLMIGFMIPAISENSLPIAPLMPLSQELFVNIKKSNKKLSEEIAEKERAEASQDFAKRSISWSVVIALGSMIFAYLIVRKDDQIEKREVIQLSHEQQLQEADEKIQVALGRFPICSEEYNDYIVKLDQRLRSYLKLKYSVQDNSITTEELIVLLSDKGVCFNPSFFFYVDKVRFFKSL